MAIERITVNGDPDALKAALETLVPAYFASVTKTSGSGGLITVSGKDENGNTLFSVGSYSNMNSATYYAYRGSSSSITATNGKVSYFYKVGVNGAFLTLANSAGTSSIAIAKAANGKTAIVLPGAVSGVYAIQPACWGDDAAYYNPLCVAVTSSSSMTGNNCQMVQVPLYGNYQQANSIPKVFYMPMAQANMRGVIQEVTSDSGLYITDGYLAMLYDAGDE